MDEEQSAKEIGPFLSADPENVWTGPLLRKVWTDEAVAQILALPPLSEDL
jgi:hypothetical protein